MTIRSIGSAAFDRFRFESVAVQDGVTIEFGIDASHSGLIASSAIVDIDTKQWVALQSRDGEDLLEFGDEVFDDTDEAAGELGSEFTAVFAIDTDYLDAAASILGPAARTRLMELDRSSGPLVIIVDPGERLDDTTTLIVARPLYGRVDTDSAAAIDIDATVRLSARVAAALA